MLDWGLSRTIRFQVGIRKFLEGQISIHMYLLVFSFNQVSTCSMNLLSTLSFLAVSLNDMCLEHFDFYKNV